MIGIYKKKEKNGLMFEPVSTIPQAFWAGEQGYYQYVVVFQETKYVKCRNGFLAKKQ